MADSLTNRLWGPELVDASTPLLNWQRTALHTWGSRGAPHSFSALRCQWQQNWNLFFLTKLLLTETDATKLQSFFRAALTAPAWAALVYSINTHHVTNDRTKCIIISEEGKTEFASSHTAVKSSKTNRCKAMKISEYAVFPPVGKKSLKKSCHPHFNFNFMTALWTWLILSLQVTAKKKKKESCFKLLLWKETIILDIKTHQR